MMFIFTEIHDQLDLISFHCQNDGVNDFLRKHALFNNQNLLSKLFVLLDQDSEAIAGIITLSAYRINLPHPKKYSIQ